MRSWMMGLAPVLLISGCTHMSLERNTLKQVTTVADLRYREVLNNLAATSVNPNSLPSFSVIITGGTQVTDTGTANPTTSWDRGGFSGQMLSLTGSRGLQENWTTDIVKDPERLLAMRCAFDLALGVTPLDCNEGSAILNQFKVAAELSKIPPGWVHIGCKHDVPHDACYVGRYCDKYAWVTPDAYDSLSRFTLVIMDIATVDLSSLVSSAPPPVTKTTETYHYNDKGQLDKVEKTVVTVSPEPAVGGVPLSPGLDLIKPRKDFSGTQGLRSLIQLQSH